MEDILSVDLQGGNSGISEGLIGRSPASDDTLLSVGTTQGFGVPVGLKGDDNLTVNGGTLADNVNDSSKSLPVLALTGDYRDVRDDVDKDDMSTGGSTPDIMSPEEKLAVSNAAANTTKTKFVKFSTHPLFQQSGPTINVRSAPPLLQV